MKQGVLFFFIINVYATFGQQILLKTYETTLSEIEVASFGLDEVKIVNTDAPNIEVCLYDENPNSHMIHIEEASSVLKIGFELMFHKESTVFKKFITKRLHRASVVIKLPKNKQLTLHGDHVDVISESYHGDLNIYINKGFINLQKVKGNVVLKLFQGNVFAQVTNTNIDVVSKKGKIVVNDTLHHKKYQKSIKNSSKFFKLTSLHTNVTLKM